MGNMGRICAIKCESVNGAFYNCHRRTMIFGKDNFFCNLQGIMHDIYYGFFVAILLNFKLNFWRYS